MSAPNAEATAVDTPGTGLLRRPPIWLFAALLLASSPMVVGGAVTDVGSTARGVFVAWPILALFVAVLVVVVRRFGGTGPPWFVALAALAWGGVVSIAASGPTNANWFDILAKLLGIGTAEVIGPVVAGPFVEEGFKVAGVALIVLATPARLSTARAGFIAGALVGIGFGVVEDASAFARFEEAREDPIGLAIVYYGIALTGSRVWVHALASGLAGAAVGLFMADGGVRRTVVLLALAVAVHGAWNLFAVLSVGLVDRVGPAAVLIGLVVKVATLVAFAIVLRRLAANERMRADADRASIPEP